MLSLSSIQCYPNKVSFIVDCNVLFCIIGYEMDAQKNGTMYSELNDNWNKLAPIIFMYERDTSRSNYISRELRRFYFKNQPISSATNKQLAEVCKEIL